MSNLYISEYSDMPQQTGILIQAGHEPAVATQKVAFTGTAGQSAAFNAKTRFVRIHVDGIASVAFGSNPTATTSDARMVAGQTEFFGVNPGDKVSAITNT